MYNEYIDKRIVARCANGLAFAGVCKSILTRENKDFLVIETDELSGFCVMIPYNFIELVLSVPITKIN